jgi:transposase
MRELLNCFWHASLIVWRVSRSSEAPLASSEMLQPESAAPVAANDAGHEAPLERNEGASTSASKRRMFTLQEKLDIVREAKTPGIRATHVARQHGIAVNQLYFWRKVYGDLLPDHGEPTFTPEQRQIADLRVQVQRLETLLGQRTFEMVLLQERLAALNPPDGKE